MPDDKKEAERIAERTITVVQQAREEHRRLDPVEWQRVQRMQQHPEARREMERTRRGMALLLLGGLVLLTAAVVMLTLLFVG